MIGGLLLQILATFLTFFINLLPNQDNWLPQSFNDAWSWLTNIVATIFWTIPSGENILFIFNTIIMFEGAIMTWATFNWIINKLRGSGN